MIETVAKLGRVVLIVGLILSGVNATLAAEPDLFELHAVSNTASAHTKAYALSWRDSSPETVLLDDAVLLDHTSIAKASLEHDSQGQASILIKLTPKGGDHFGAITTKYLDKRLGFVLNGQLCCAPVVKSEMFGGSISIVGNFSESEAADLVKKINGSVSP